ncbi:MAG: DUF1003 domain-containing protein [Burkholderiaceae bacterium]|nr:DUF1003 domain-containing protein [Burkholderiaceae bacterium]
MPDHTPPPIALRTDPPPCTPPKVDHLRFQRNHAHLASAFGTDRFALQAEAFARFFGTPLFLGAQTLVVAVWIVFNVWGGAQFDPYPFILLNLAFSLQAAYAAPLILLAQTRQATRDKAQGEADAEHREALAVANEQRQTFAAQSAAQMLILLEQNTQLTAQTRELAVRLEALTFEIHQRFLGPTEHAQSTGVGGLS